MSGTVAGTICTEHAARRCRGEEKDCRGGEERRGLDMIKGADGQGKWLSVALSEA